MTSLGWAFGHFFNEWVYQRHRSNWHPEYRLHGVWLPISSMACGLLTYGLTMNYGKHWIGIAFGWIMVNIGMTATIVSVHTQSLPSFQDTDSLKSNYSVCVGKVPWSINLRLSHLEHVADLRRLRCWILSASVDNKERIGSCVWDTGDCFVRRDSCDYHPGAITRTSTATARRHRALMLKTNHETREIPHGR